jgi:dTDP-glucose pyrophosphorylase
MKKNYKQSILDSKSIKDAVKKIDLGKLNSIVTHNYKKKVTGIFTMGDFRRAVFFGLDIEDKVYSVTNKNFKYLIQGYSKLDAKKIFLNDENILDIPVLNKKFELIKIISRSNFFSHKELVKKNFFFSNFPVVIMAGGKGTRLDPFTRILPKSLIPLGNNPIIRVIMDNFKKHGSKKFYISVNEKSSMIKAYFHDLKSLYNIKYIEEKKPLGTAGSLKMLKNKLKNTFFVTNSDILVNSYYPSILEFHKKNSFDLTLVSSVRNYIIPYGVCSFDKEGVLININEKPEHNFFVSTGLYVIEPRVLKLIPDNIKYDMTELLNKVRESKMKVGVFPIPENSWIDIGQWSEFNKNINRFNI